MQADENMDLVHNFAAKCGWWDKGQGERLGGVLPKATIMLIDLQPNADALKKGEKSSVCSEASNAWSRIRSFYVRQLARWESLCCHRTRAPHQPPHTTTTTLTRPL